jgi:hypothetical protein
MTIDTPRLPQQPEIQKPEYHLEKNFKPVFLKEQPFLRQSSESEDTLKASFIAFNHQMSSSITKLSTGEKSEVVTKKLNLLASYVMKETAKNLGYDESEPIEIAKVDLFTLDATLGMLAKHIKDSTNSGQNLNEIQASINSFLHPKLSSPERKENIEASINKIPEQTQEEFLSPKNQLFLSTLSETNIIQLTRNLLTNPEKNSIKISHLAHNLPTSNLTLVTSQILDEINQNPENQSLQNLFRDINSKSSHTEEAFQEEFVKNLSNISPRLGFARGLGKLPQNRLFLGLSYVWSTLVFLGNSMQAVTLTMGSERSKNKAAILKSLALAGAAGSVMGVTGASILTGKPPLKIAENFLTKAFNYLSYTKEDVDAMSAQEAQVTIPRLLDQSGPYIASIFTDDDIIQSMVATNTVIDGKENLTDAVAAEKLNKLHEEIKKKSREKAIFFENNFLKPSKSNPKKSLLLVYFMQKSYQKSDITNAGSFMSKLKQDPDKYPSIDDFKNLANE